MHEAHLAGTIATHVRAADLEGRVLRVTADLRALHGHESREALAAHLAAELGIAPGSIEVCTRPIRRLCSECAAPFEQHSESDSCPACGGVPLPLAIDHEEIDLEIVDRAPGEAH